MKKLKNNSGATILMALLLILLAMAVGAAILTAAVSAAHHMKSDREAQQNYLTVSSAAELIRDSINGQTYERTLTVKREANRDEQGTVTSYTETRTLDVKPNPPFPGPMQAWLTACVKNSDNRNVLYASFQKCDDTITVTLDNAPDLKQVQAKFSAQADGKIQVELSLVQENGKTGDDCRMTLTMQGTLKEETPESYSSEDVDSYIYKTTVKWEPQRITKGIEVTGP